MQKIINRAIQPILEKWLFRGKILIIYGARQVGKTTLCKSLMANLGMQDAMYFNCEIQSIQLGLSNNEPQALKL
jgi:predicted AAA+ superfamily ATPase